MGSARLFQVSAWCALSLLSGSNLSPGLRALLLPHELGDGSGQLSPLSDQ